jgi:hypothetical protein
MGDAARKVVGGKDTGRKEKGERSWKVPARDEWDFEDTRKVPNVELCAINFT